MCRTGIVAAVSVKVIEPVFESQTKTKLGSSEMEPGGQSMRSFVGDFLGRELDNFLHKQPGGGRGAPGAHPAERARAQGAQRHPQAGPRARQEGQPAQQETARLPHPPQRPEEGRPQAEDSTLFITEGDSASGSITKSRDVNTQAVFSLKGKPLNSYGLTKKVSTRTRSST
jgi:topoisomerase-4 subunit B